MATSILCRRTTVICRSLRGTSSLKSVLSVSAHGEVRAQTAHYNPKPFRLNVSKPYIPDKQSEKTPEWQKTAKYDRKLFGRYGSASDIDPASLWPSYEQLDKLIEEEKAWHTTLEVMLKNVEAKEKLKTDQRLAKENLIAANMAKMPKMVADWRRERHETKQKQKEEKAKRAKLLAEARERFGYAVDPRSPKFMELVAEIEKENKKKQKLMKRRLREEQAASPVTPPAVSL